ncbi:hypothetical protein EVAR_26419_1 [Eumeta japonica]|uniref:Uncharacterized protein n=1 Tax=Eumeta variegata TaxID=151549 RepID=A0A4C1VSH5_EUMVA|nr:hypothetical protein EVAR_26419_1 [Eumeta japonica]
MEMPVVHHDSITLSPSVCIASNFASGLSPFASRCEVVKDRSGDKHSLRESISIAHRPLRSIDTMQHHEMRCGPLRCVRHCTRHSHWYRAVIEASAN